MGKQQKDKKNSPTIGWRSKRSVCFDAGKRLDIKERTNFNKNHPSCDEKGKDHTEEKGHLVIVWENT